MIKGQLDLEIWQMVSVLQRYVRKKSGPEFRSMIPVNCYVRLIFQIFVFVFIANFGFPANLNAAEKNFPFYPGEKLVFHLKWGFIPAGEAVLEVLPVERR